MHVARIRSGYTDKAGRRREYESSYLRRTYRDGGKVRHETLANLSALPGQAIDAIEAALKGTPLVPAGSGGDDHRVGAARARRRACTPWRCRLGLPALLGPACPQRDLALALVISRVAAPASKLSTLTWWADTTLGADLGVAGASTDDIYAAMDWLAGTAGPDREAARRPPPGAGGQPVADGACSTCRPRGWKDGTARWPPAATPGTARKASCRSSTGCSPTPKAAPSRSGCFPATPATPPSFTEIVTGGAGHSSSSRRWSWSATAA